MSEMHQSVKDTVLAVLPEAVNATKSKRNLLKDIGGEIGGFFGLASSKDVNKLRKVVISLVKHGNDITTEVNLQKTLLTTFMNVSSHRMDNIVSIVRNDHRFIESAVASFDARAHSAMKWIASLTGIAAKQARLLSKLQLQLVLQRGYIVLYR
jgi:hypothetical protein